MIKMNKCRKNKTTDNGHTQNRAIMKLMGKICSQMEKKDKYHPQNLSIQNNNSNNNTNKQKMHKTHYKQSNNKTIE